MRESLLILLLITFSGCSILGSGEDDDGLDIPGKLVFSAKDEEGDSQIYSMNGDGTKIKQLTTMGSAMQPAWSSDGTQIVFASYHNATTLGPYLYIMDENGNNLRPLKRMPYESPEYLIGTNPVWSPDDTKIAYEVCTNCELGGENYEVVTIEVAGEEYDSTQQHSITNHSASDMYPTWSQDGSKIAFASERAYYDADTLRFRKDLYVTDADGENVERLTQTGNATHPKWSPDNNKIAYEWNSQGNNVFIYHRNSGQIDTLETGLEFSGTPLWGIQGKELLIFGRETEESQVEVRLISLEGESVEVLERTSRNIIGQDYDWHIE